MAYKRKWKLTAKALEHLVDEVLSKNHDGLTAREILQKVREDFLIPYGVVTKKEINSYLYKNYMGDDSKFVRIEAYKPIWYLRKYAPEINSSESSRALELLVKDFVNMIVSACVKEEYIKPSSITRKEMVELIAERVIEEKGDTIINMLGNYFKANENSFEQSKKAYCVKRLTDMILERMDELNIS